MKQNNPLTRRITCLLWDYSEYLFPNSVCSTRISREDDSKHESFFKLHLLVDNGESRQTWYRERATWDLPNMWKQRNPQRALRTQGQNCGCKSCICKPVQINVKQLFRGERTANSISAGARCCVCWTVDCVSACWFRFSWLTAALVYLQLLCSTWQSLLCVTLNYRLPLSNTHTHTHSVTTVLMSVWFEAVCWHWDMLSKLCVCLCESVCVPEVSGGPHVTHCL